jgi:hypothetical protein
MEAELAGDRSVNALSDLTKAFGDAEKNGDPNQLESDLLTHLHQIPGHEKDEVSYTHGLSLTLPDGREIPLATYNPKETLAKRQQNLSNTPDQRANLAESIAGMIKTNPDSKEFQQIIAKSVQSDKSPSQLQKWVQDHLGTGYKFNYERTVRAKHSVASKNKEINYGENLDGTY